MQHFFTKKEEKREKMSHFIQNGSKIVRSAQRVT